VHGPNMACSSVGLTSEADESWRRNAACVTADRCTSSLVKNMRVRTSQTTYISWAKKKAVCGFGWLKCTVKVARTWILLLQLGRPSNLILYDAITNTRALIILTNPCVHSRFVPCSTLPSLISLQVPVRLLIHHNMRTIVFKCMNKAAFCIWEWKTSVCTTWQAKCTHHAPTNDDMAHQSTHTDPTYNHVHTSVWAHSFTRMISFRHSWHECTDTQRKSGGFNLKKHKHSHVLK